MKQVQTHNIPDIAHLNKSINKMYTKLPPRQYGLPIQHNHFTRSRQRGFLAQSTVEVDAYEQHYANHVYRHETGAK